MTPPRDTPDARPALAADSHLARLVQRVTPGEPVLQRRRPSMFEPAPVGSLADRGDVTVDAAPLALSALPLPLPRRSEPVAATPPRAPLPRTATAVTAPATAAPIAHPPRHVLRETLHIDASLRAPALPVPRPASVATAPTTDAHHVTSTHAADHASAPAREPPVRVDPAQRREAEPLRAEAVAPHVTVRHRSASAAPPPAPAAGTSAPLLRPVHASSPATTSVPRTAQRAAALQRALHAQPAAAASPREPPPPVQVTIGRIEVRAVTPPAAAPERRARAAPRLSLEQYLHERQRGGR